jgi:ribA/ribD-fused uncharacterized protein
MPAITEFRGEHFFLSNFYMNPITFEGIIYPSVEHAFAAAKTSDPVERQRIAEAKTAGEAKRLGRKVTLIDNWDDKRLDAMAQLLRLKFQDTELKNRLLATAGRRLVEGNNWGDRFWGTCQGTGKNHLGELLMKLRDELSSE